MTPNYNNTRLACYIGYVTQAIVVNLAPLFFIMFREDFGVSYSELGRLVLWTFVVQIAVDALMVKFINKLGYRFAAISSHLFSAAGLIMLGILPNVMNDAYLAILISVLTYSVGGGMIEVVISPVIDSLPSDDKASGMCLLHSFYSWGQVFVVLVTTLTLKFIGHANWETISLIWAAVPTFNLFFFMTVPIPEITPEAKGTPFSEFLKTPVFYMMTLLMICGGAAEQSMAQWASLFAEEGLGVTKVLGDLLGPCLFAVNMGIGRTVYGLLGSKMNIKNGLLGCGITTIVCYGLTSVSSSPVLGLVGCALCGFGVSLMWPGILGMTSDEFGKKTGPALFAFLALAGDVGCSLGPWITGKVSDAYVAANSAATSSDALRMGLLAAAAFPVIMTAGIIFMKALDKKKDS
ncbi:MAG: MFS transporter [Clostridia bacterium]|nr:MFS transporter [Clostridia bacterium]